MSKLAVYIIVVFASSALSGWRFHSWGVNKTTVKYEKMIADAEQDARDRLRVREEELHAMSVFKVEEALANERKRKPIEKEVIKYVVENKPVLGCAIDDAGMQLNARYIDASFYSED